MKSKDVILQVAHETAEVMEEISEQLFDETDARFDEIAEAIAESAEKIENLYADFSEYTETSKKSEDNQGDLISEFKGLKEDFETLKKENKKNVGKVEEKMTRLITDTSELPALIKDVSEQIGTTSQSSKEAEENIMEAVGTLSESLLKIQEMQTSMTEKMKKDDFREKLGILSEKLSETEKSIRTETATVGRMSETLDGYGSVLDRLDSSMKTAQNNADKILATEEANADSIKKLGERSVETSAELIGKLGEVLSCLDALSASVRSVAERQEEIHTKQDRLEADMEYLKLPFYKRWFSKGK